MAKENNRTTKRFFNSLRGFVMTYKALLLNGLCRAWILPVIAMLLVPSIGCSALNTSRGPLSSDRAVERYIHRVTERPDGSLSHAYITRPEGDRPMPLVFLVQGSGCASHFEELPGGGYLDVNAWIFTDTSRGGDVRLAFLEKRGVRFGAPMSARDEEEPSEEFLLHDTLEEGAADVVRTVERLASEPGVDRSRILLVGFGEGAVKAAAAARRCPLVTHLAYLGAGGWPRLHERIVLERKRIALLHPPPEDPEALMEAFFDDLEDLAADPDALSPIRLGVTPRHFHGFELVSPLEDLLALDIPLFHAVGGESAQVPPASVDAVRASFLAAGKDNLTQRIHPGLDQGFRVVDTGDLKRPGAFHLPKVMDAVFAWFLHDA